ncbi:hypothetical protein AOT83_23845 [Mycobacteroides sp. H001]|nr:hypothetical protein AOT86_05800 [Mycobacteroides sp. H072]KRQ37070.1 hypothetical protein AOT84_12515 [Mycobacteroides sp. H002]KRQ55669.1 hypothetical protein AOT85_01750 [Mycobacteroides sp. H054]KRQ66278.1 hypothetical protein AOT83_23845 [Mycobacteroides sp. H001]OHU32642.1 hypothetical protein BKG79_23930 [Mycobacteroides chelonae]
MTLYALRDKYRLLQGENIRFISTDVLVHCHNKMIVVDGKRVLVSSQNWSDSAVTKNREAGLWIAQAKVAKYFQGIFETDWNVAFQALPRATRRDVVTPQSISGGGFVKVQPADYQEV